MIEENLKYDALVKKFPNFFFLPTKNGTLIKRITANEQEVLVKKGLEPLWCKAPEFLILGSFPGRMSFKRREYYSDSGNHF